MDRVPRHTMWAVAVGAILVAAGAVAILNWLSSGLDVTLAPRVPLAGEDDTAASSLAAPVVDLRGEFRGFDGQPSALTNSWPRFRGADSDNVVKEPVPLVETWPADGPPVLWAVDLGEGYAGPAVRHGCVYLLDYDESAQSDALRCFSLDDGREIWRRSYRIPIKRNHGMSRTTPAVGEDAVVSIGPRCHVLCADARTGDFKWGIDLVRDWGAREPLWYTAQCPLIDGDTVVLAPCGKALMMGVRLADGQVAWQTPNPRKWEMSHSSVMPMTFGGRRMYVYCARGGIAGVAADGSDRGALLWSSTNWNNAITAPSPVPLDGGRILLTAGYGAGSLLLQLAETGGEFSAQAIRAIDKTEFSSEQHTPIYRNGRLYTVMANDAGELKRQLACYDPAGRMLWTSGKNHRFGLGPLLIAGDRILVLSEDGVLTMAHTARTDFEIMAEARILRGREAWAPMAMVQGRLLARDSKRMVCLDMRKP